VRSTVFFFLGFSVGERGALSVDCLWLTGVHEDHSKRDKKFACWPFEMLSLDLQNIENADLKFSLK
jgi:hypothetical protein